MMDTILISAGGIILALSVVFYRYDCKGKPSATMGGEMSFSAFWTFGLIPLMLGVLPSLGVSRWWTIPGVVGLYVASFPIRVILRRFFCTPFKQEPTGFQKYIRSTEGTANTSLNPISGSSIKLPEKD